MALSIHGSSRVSKTRGGALSLVVDGMTSALTQAWIGLLFKRTTGAPTTWSDKAEYFAQLLLDYPTGTFSTNGDTSRRVSVSSPIAAGDVAAAAPDDYIWMIYIVSATTPDGTADFAVVKASGRVKA